MKLRADQVQLVENFVDVSNVTIPSLRDDLVDHLCCVIEERLDENNQIFFDELLIDAVNEFCPEGLHQIQRRTDFLLNQKNIVMKKFIYLIGFLGSALLTVGTVFKLMHLPGADELTMTGLSLLVFVFVPLHTFNRFKLNVAAEFSDRLRLLFGAASGILFGMSVIFKYLHLQGTDSIFLTSAFLFVAGFLPLNFFKLYKESVA